jgi:hypothetical protein
MTNVYRIGVSIAMTNGISPVLGVLARDMLGLQGGIGKLEAGFSRLKLAVGGALAIAGGVALLAGMNKTLDAAKDLTREQGKMLSAGLSNQQVAEATGKAWSMSASIMGARVSENLAAIAHLRAAFGDLREAEMLAPGYQRNSVALGAITGKDGEAENYKLARLIHMSGGAVDPTTGKLDPRLFAQRDHLYTAMIAAGGGKIDAGMLMTFQQNAGSYGANLTDQGRINMIGAIQSMGGRAGTQMSSLNRALKDGVLQKSTLAQLESIGLIDPNLVRKAGGNAGHGNGGSPGGGISFMPGALKNESQFRGDLAGWVWETLVPTLKAKGITTAADQVNWIQHAKLTTNPTRLLSELIRNQPVDRNEAANVGLALKTDQYAQVQSTDLDQNKKNLHDAFKDMMTAFAVPLIKPAIATMQSITGAVKGITAWASIHPETVRLIGGAIVVLGSALIGFGVVAVGVAAFAAVAAGGAIGLVVAGIGTVIGAVTALVVINWPSVMSAAHGMADFVRMINQVGAYVLAHPLKGLTAPIKDLPAAAAAAAAAQAKANHGHWGVHFSPGQRPSPVWMPEASRASAVPPPAANQNILVRHTTTLSGKVIADEVSKHQARATGANSFGTGRFDPAASLPTAAHN